MRAMQWEWSSQLLTLSTRITAQSTGHDTKMKITRRQLRHLINEAQWGRFEHGAAPLDEPPLDSGPMSPEMQQRVFDMLVDSGSEPSELKASGEYPDVESLDSEVARRYFDRKFGGLEDMSQDERHPLDADGDGKLTISEMKITRRQLRQIIKEAIETHPGHGDADGDGVKDFADTQPYIDHDLVDRLMDIIEEHDHKARWDGRYIIGIAHATDRDGKAIQDIEKFDATLERRALIRNVRNWLGY